MIKLKDLLTEDYKEKLKAGSGTLPGGKLLASIVGKNGQVYELQQAIRFGGYSTPVVVKRPRKGAQGTQIELYPINMYSKPAIEKFKKEYGKFGKISVA
jgi:hypothetical protein|tara:strand:+ start:130 stop:426 length:297 start_codon:yes stop_codon:yes gene_type:complete